MLKIVRASVLMMLLACAASAGEMPNTVTVLPTPPPPSVTTQESFTEDDALPEPTQQTTADNFRETWLNLLDSVFALF